MKATFDHLAITVENIVETVAFYLQQFDGAKVLYQDETWALLSFGGLKLAFVIADQHPSHLAMRVESRAELEEVANSTGKAIVVHRDRSESFYMSDPSGNELEIIYYPEKS